MKVAEINFLKNRPLAERMRPFQLADYVGQQHLLAEGEVLRNSIENKLAHSLIFWGPPGVGKTTLAKIIARHWDLLFIELSAIQAGVADLRSAINNAKAHNGALLFIDEIHRFNKAQQDRLLGAVESGVITLIGATTENPSFEVISALLSRTQVYVLKELGKSDLECIIQHAVSKDEILKERKIELLETDTLLLFSGGDARRLLNLLELAINQFSKGKTVKIDNKLIERIGRSTAKYDKSGEQHYDIISAFIKSMRGSDPNAAMYWLARMFVGGEDPKFIARRMVIFASEDIGNANPNALLLANACFDAVHRIGYPECEIPLAQTTIYLATSVKSNASYAALKVAKKLAAQTQNLSVPLNIRNAPSQLMKELDYGKDYQYAHNFEGNFVQHDFLPKALKGKKIYEPQQNPKEEQIRKQLANWWRGWYDYE